MGNMKVSHHLNFENGYRWISQTSNFPVQLFAQGHCNTIRSYSTICLILTVLKCGIILRLNAR